MLALLEPLLCYGSYHLDLSVGEQLILLLILSPYLIAYLGGTLVVALAVFAAAWPLVYAFICIARQLWARRATHAEHPMASINCSTSQLRAPLPQVRRGWW